MALTTNRRAFRTGLAAGLTLTAGFLSVGVSEAQIIPGSPGPPPTRLERPDERSPAARQAENYDALGVRVGNFLLLPLLEVDEAYNDNVFAQSAGSGPTASFLQMIRPSVELRSTWSNHMLNLYARGNIGFYTAAPTQNFQDVSVGADGRLDIQRNWNTYGGLSWNRQHEDPGLPNTVTGPTNVTIYNQLSGNVGYYQKITRFSARVDFRADNYTYFDNGLGLAQGVVPNSDRNRTELREALRLGYEFLDGYEVWVRSGFNQRMYVSPVDAAGFARNSSGWDVVGGLSFDLGGITTAELFAGYLQQNYVDPRFAPVQGPQFGATIYWNPLKELWFKPYARRTINETSYVGDASYLNTSVGIDANYNFRPNLRLDGRVDYTTADYQTTGRFDQYIGFGAGLMYMPVNEFFIGPRYQYVHRSSNQPSLDYGQNLIMLRLGARL